MDGDYPNVTHRENFRYSFEDLLSLAIATDVEIPGPGGEKLLGNILSIKNN